MDKSKLRLYYLYFVPITILQSVSSLLVMSVLSVSDYGMFVLYLSAVSFFFFLTLGIQNGYTLLSKDQTINNGVTARLSNFITLVFLCLMFISIPILSVVPVENYWKLAFISACLTTIFIFQKSVFRTEMKIHSLNIYILCFRLIILIDLIFYMTSRDIYIMLLIDVLLRGVLVLVGSVVIWVEFKDYASINYSDLKLITPKLVGVGLPVMLGNWIVTIYTVLDKTLISGYEYELGLYSFAITSVLLVRVLLVPLSELYFVTLDQNESSKNYYNKLNIMWKLGSCLVLVAAVVAILIIGKFGFFEKYISALPVLLILLNIIPLSTSLDVYVYNFAKRSNGKKFMVLAIIGALITGLTLGVYTTLFELNLIVYSCLVYVTYLIIYIMHISSKLKLNQVLNLIAKNIVFVVIYSLVLMFFI